MRVLVFLLALLGAAGCGLFGFVAHSGLQHNKETDPSFKAALAVAGEVDKLSDEQIRQHANGDPKQIRAAVRAMRELLMLVYTLMAALGLGLVGAFLTLFRKRVLAAVL